MPRPALSLEEAELRMRPADVHRPSRARERGVVGRAGRPKMPADLPDDCRAVWKLLVKQLARRRTLTPGDGPQLELYCRLHKQWVAACAQVDQHGVMITEERYSRDGNPYTVRVINPAVKLAKDLAAELKDSLRDMGLTSIARDKVSEVQPKDKEAAEIPGTVGYYRAHADEILSPVEIPDVDLEAPMEDAAPPPTQEDATDE